MTALDFCEYLSSLATPDVRSTNIYAGDSVMPQITRANLRLYIEQMLSLAPAVLLVGEAPGKDGCALTGVPFTSEFHLLSESFFREFPYRVLNKHNPRKERTASYFWDIINEVGSHPLIWNIFPFHPFDPVSGRNRCPNKGEIEFGKEVLNALLSMYNIEKIYAVGRKAAHALKDHPLYAGYVRHPSYGGVNDCRRQLIEYLSDK